MTKIVSLGDVLRCTVILEPLKEKFSNTEISWLVSKEAIPLMTNNPHIDKLLIWDEFIPYVLMREQYDMVINLEKISGICALADMINAWEKIGFRFNSKTGMYDTYLQSLIAKRYIENKEATKDIWQKIIVEMVGCEWKEQEYSLGYKPQTKEEFDIGFNINVGKKWPTKAMPLEHWKLLEEKIKKNNFTVTWQEGLDSIYDYIDWINKSKLLITSDSLGLHIALALKKNVIGLFGPTSGKEVFFYGRGIALCSKKDKCPIAPCYQGVCNHSKFCMDIIDIDEVTSEVKKYLGQKR